MTTEPEAIAPPAYLATLAEAAASCRGEAQPPAARLVVNALLQAEAITRQQRVNHSAASLVGHWRLCFTTGTPKADRADRDWFRRGWYVPRWVQAEISFAGLGNLETTGQIDNQAVLGPLQVRFTGPCQHQGKKNLLAFDFTRIQINLFGRTIYGGNVRRGQAIAQNWTDRAIANLPFFAFFLVTDDFIAARGRGGGLALWVRDRV